MSSGATKPPLVTIGMPAYNDECFIRQAIESLLSQSFVDFELVISDNASTDLTGRVCEEYARTDPRIRYYRQKENVDAIGNFSFVLGKAAGRYFMWAASDDRWHVDFLITVVTAIQSCNNCVGAFTPYTATDENGVPFGKVRWSDYAGRTPLVRIRKLAMAYDDGCIYSLWDLDRIRQFELPQWWRINRRSAVNWAYPVLFGLLAAGELAVAGDQAMWFNRVKTTSVAFPPFKRRYEYVLRLMLYKMNVFSESLRYTFKGSGSLLVAAAAAPVLLLRWALDCGWALAVAIRDGIRAPFR